MLHSVSFTEVDVFCINIFECLCYQGKEMWEEVSGVCGIRDNKKKMKSSPGPRHEPEPQTVLRKGQACSMMAKAGNL